MKLSVTRKVHIPISPPSSETRGEKAPIASAAPVASSIVPITLLAPRTPQSGYIQANSG